MLWPFLQKICLFLYGLPAHLIIFLCSNENNISSFNFGTLLLGLALYVLNSPGHSLELSTFLHHLLLVTITIYRPTKLRLVYAQYYILEYKISSPNSFKTVSNSCERNLGKCELLYKSKNKHITCMCKIRLQEL